MMIHSSAQFGWNKNSLTLEAEASTLGRGNCFMAFLDLKDERALKGFHPEPPFKIHLGFKIISEHTDNEPVFYLSDVFYVGCEEDREIASWRFKPLPRCEHMVRPGTTVVIWND